MVRPLLTTKGFFVLIFILLLLSPAAASAVSAENKLTGCFYGQYKNSIEGFLTKVIETPSLIFAQEFSSPLTESRVGVNKHIEIMNPFLLPGSRYPCRFQSLSACGNGFPGFCHPCTAGRKKGNAQNYLRFFNRDLCNTYVCRNQYPQHCQFPA